MLDVALQSAMVTLVIQGLKQLGLKVEGNPAKVVTLAIAALFLFANGLIDAFVPEAGRPVLKMAIDLLKAALALAVPAGLYGYAKLIQNRQPFAKIVQ